MTQITLGNGFYEDYSLTVSSQRCTNWWPMYVQTQGLSQAVLYPSPGNVELDDLGESEYGRGTIEFKDKLYVVQNRTLYLIDRVLTEAGVPQFISTALGTIEGTARVFIAKNNTQICICVPGRFLYIYDEVNGVQDISNTFLSAYDGLDELSLPETVVYLDGYFFLSNPRYIFASNINDGTSFNGLSFGSAEMDPDKIVALFVYRNQLYAFGTEITEVYDNVGTSPFPLLRNDGYVIDKGTSSPHSIVECEESFMFIGGSRDELPAAWRIESGTPIKISTPPIDRLLEALLQEELEVVFANSLSMEGGCFTVFSLPDRTLAHDVHSSRVAQSHIWHEHTSFSHGSESAWCVSHVTKVYNLLITTQQFNGKIGNLCLDDFQEFGTQILRTFSSPTVFANGEPIYVDAIEITIESGTSPLGEDLLLTLSTSQDGGKTWGNQRVRTIGTRGESRKRLVWRRMGRFDRLFNFRLQFSGNAKMVIVRADVKFAGNLGAPNAANGAA